MALIVVPTVFLLDNGGSESVLSKAIQLLLAKKLLVITFPFWGFCLFICTGPGGNWRISKNIFCRRKLPIIGSESLKESLSALGI